MSFYHEILIFLTIPSFIISLTCYAFNYLIKFTPWLIGGSVSWNPKTDRINNSLSILLLFFSVLFFTLIQSGDANGYQDFYFFMIFVFAGLIHSLYLVFNKDRNKEDLFLISNWIHKKGLIETNDQSITEKNIAKDISENLDINKPTNDLKEFSFSVPIISENYKTHLINRNVLTKEGLINQNFPPRFHNYYGALIAAKIANHKKIEFKHGDKKKFFNQFSNEIGLKIDESIFLGTLSSINKNEALEFTHQEYIDKELNFI